MQVNTEFSPCSRSTRGLPQKPKFLGGADTTCIIPESCVPKYFLALSSSNEVLLRLFFFFLIGLFEPSTWWSYLARTSSKSTVAKGAV